jgi:hypothetical protein
MNLAEFVGEDKFRAGLLPSQSEGKEKGKGKGKGKGRFEDEEPRRGGRDRFPPSAADEADTWRPTGGRGGFGDRDGGRGGSRFDKGDDDDNWRTARGAGAGAGQNRFAKRDGSPGGDRWSNMRKEVDNDGFPTPGDARPEGLRNLKERMAEAKRKKEAKERGEEVSESEGESENVQAQAADVAEKFSIQNHC